MNRGADESFEEEGVKEGEPGNPQVSEEADAQVELPTEVSFSSFERLCDEISKRRTGATHYRYWKSGNIRRRTLEGGRYFPLDPDENNPADDLPLSYTGAYGIILYKESAPAQEGQAPRYREVPYNREAPDIAVTVKCHRAPKAGRSQAPAPTPAPPTPVMQGLQGETFGELHLKALRESWAREERLRAELSRQQDKLQEQLDRELKKLKKKGKKLRKKQGATKESWLQGMVRSATSDPAGFRVLMEIAVAMLKELITILYDDRGECPGSASPEGEMGQSRGPEAAATPAQAAAPPEQPRAASSTWETMTAASATPPPPAAPAASPPRAPWPGPWGPVPPTAAAPALRFGVQSPGQQPVAQVRTGVSSVISSVGTSIGPPFKSGQGDSDDVIDGMSGGRLMRKDGGDDSSVGDGSGGDGSGRPPTFRDDDLGPTPALRADAAGHRSAAGSAPTALRQGLRPPTPWFRPYAKANWLYAVRVRTLRRPQVGVGPTADWAEKCWFRPYDPSCAAVASR